MTASKNAPPLATFLVVVLVCVGGTLGGAAGSWPAAVVDALMRGGGALGEIQTKRVVFAVLPDGTSFWLNALQLVCTMASFGGAMVLALRLWRFLVVETLAIMTDAEVAECYKRAPGF